MQANCGVGGRGSSRLTSVCGVKSQTCLHTTDGVKWKVGRCYSSRNAELRFKRFALESPFCYLLAE